MQDKNIADKLAKIDIPCSLEQISEADQALAKGLVEARLGARVLSEPPAQVPQTLEQAYDAQAAAVSLWPDDVVAWKVARLPPQDRGVLPAERLVGPAFRSTIRAVESEATTDSKILDGSFAVIEAEYVFELAAAIPPVEKDWSDADISEQISRAFCGAEVATSPMPNVIELGATAIIADLGVNNGVIVGPEIPDFRNLPEDALSVQVTVDGSVVGEAKPGPLVADPFIAMRNLLRHCASRGIELPKGTLVSTGLLTGAHDVRDGSTSRLDFGSFGWFDIKFEAIKPQ